MPSAFLVADHSPISARVQKCHSKFPASPQFHRHYSQVFQSRGLSRLRNARWQVPVETETKHKLLASKEMCDNRSGFVHSYSVCARKCLPQPSA